MKRITAAQQIYQAMREQIIFLELAPGSPIDMQKLVDELEVSRSPLRDALLKLQEDNLVEIFPQKGSRVSKINLKEVEVERFMRATLELAVIPQFAQVCTNEQILNLRAAIENQKIALEFGSKKNFLKADDEFHKIFFTTTGNTRIWKLIQHQSGNYRRIRFLANQVPEILHGILAEHEEIFAAFSEQNFTKAEKLDKYHLTKLLSEIYLLQEKYPDFFE